MKVEHAEGCAMMQGDIKHVCTCSALERANAEIGRRIDDANGFLDSARATAYELLKAREEIERLEVTLKAAEWSAKHNYEGWQQEVDRSEAAAIRADHWEREFKYHNKAHGGEWEMRQRLERAEAELAALTQSQEDR